MLPMHTLLEFEIWHALGCLDQPNLRDVKLASILDEYGPKNGFRDRSTRWFSRCSSYNRASGRSHELWTLKYQIVLCCVSEHGQGLSFGDADAYLGSAGLGYMWLIDLWLGGRTLVMVFGHHYHPEFTNSQSSCPGKLCSAARQLAIARRQPLKNSPADATRPSAH